MNNSIAPAPMPLVDEENFRPNDTRAQFANDARLSPEPQYPPVSDVDPANPRRILSTKTEG